MSESKLQHTIRRRHPLQRYESPSKGLSGALHVAGLISFYHSFKFLADNPNVFVRITSMMYTLGIFCFCLLGLQSQNESFGWHLQFLTIIGITICTACFTFGLIADITNSPLCFTLKNYLSLVAAPIEIVISILYWGLRAIDDALIVPADLPMPPVLYDIGFHLIPAVVLTLDTILLSPPWPSMPANPQAPTVMFAASSAIAFAYWWWIELCYSYNGYYPYPIFGILTTIQRIGLFALSGATMWMVGSALRALYALVNGYESVEHVEKVQKLKVDGKRE